VEDASVNSYTITIAPNDDSGNSTTIVVDTSGDQVSITDVHLHAGGGLAGGQLPTVDFGLLLRAITTPTTPQPIEAAVAARAVSAEPTAPAAVTVDERPDAAAAPRTGRATRTRRRGTRAGRDAAGQAWPARTCERREDSYGTEGDHNGGPESLQGNQSCRGEEGTRVPTDAGGLRRRVRTDRFPDRDR
jgi:hypothetical protein